MNNTANPKKKTRGKFQRRADELTKRWKQAEEAAEELRTEVALLKQICASLRVELAELERELA